MSDTETQISSSWDMLQRTYQLTAEHMEKFKRYLQLLQQWNDRFNITAHVDPVNIITYHFYDSLALSSFVDLTDPVSLGDVGTGGGFPGLPLKIMYPHVKLVLIEVNAKKREFLAEVVKQLELENVIISELDWRTFLRQTSYNLDYVVARASLQPSELLRMFKPSSGYKDATLVYWASAQWQPESKEASHIVRDESYQVDTKTRRLIFFAA